MEKPFTHHPSSYRDPSGFIFTRDNNLYRQVNKIFAADYDYFISSGCYAKLVAEQLLVPHEVISENLTGSAEWHTTLMPATIPFITYPYEWSFDMLKNAALLTLRLLKEAIGFGMILKDATPYNIQWMQGRLVFIDTLSFEKYNEAEPWVAYHQFCEQFLGPLLLMHYRKMPLQPLLLAWPEGIPLNVTKSLLPSRSRFSLYTYLHIHLNAKVSSKSKPGEAKKVTFTKQKLLNLVNSLESLVKRLTLPPQKSTWSEYYEEASGRDNYLEEKKKMISEWTASLQGVSMAADLGANDGVFAQLLAKQKIYTLAADLDPYCINNLYHAIKKSDEKNIQPLIADLSNPSPAIGLNNEERSSLTARIKVDLGLALALIHHLAIGRNIPFEKIAEFFAGICKKYLVIEFVPKTDEKVTLMLSGKKDIYQNYSETGFSEAFQPYFHISRKEAIAGSGRVLYLMTKHES